MSNFGAPPIPSYEEATSSRSSQSPSHTHPDPSPISPSADHENDAERQGLLSRPAEAPPASVQPRPDGYYAARVESARSSVDSMEFLGNDPQSPRHSFHHSNVGDAEELTGLRREMEALEVLDPPSQDQGRVRTMFVKGFSNITRRFNRFRYSVSFFRLPSWVRIPNLPTIPEEYRPRWFIIARLVGLLSILLLVYVLFLMDGLPGSSGPGAFNHESVRAFAQGNINEERIRNLLQRVTAYDHVAGSQGDLYVSRWVSSMFRATGMDRVQTSEYPVRLNYPKPGGRFVAIVEPKEQEWQAQIDEDDVYQNPTPQQQQMGVFHGLSHDGDVRGPLVFANYGSVEDFHHLRSSNALPKDSIALIRMRLQDHTAGVAVKNAELAGCIGALLYLDPADDVDGIWPDGRSRRMDSVTRGSVSLTNWILGDVLTPGWVSSRRSRRIDPDESPALVRIPSMPLSLKDAQHLLISLRGHGQKVPNEWIGRSPEVEEWWTGDGRSPVVRLRNDQDHSDNQKIWNVVGEYSGYEAKAKRVVIGAPRDSWCFGAMSPGSGTAIMLEVLNIFDLLHARGWRPLRTVQFASWDGSQYNLIGSTEYTEERLALLQDNTVAYIDLGRGVGGPNFDAAGSPSLLPVLERCLNRVNDPVANGTLLRQTWSSNNQKLREVSVDGDYAPFQYMVGAPVLDLGFGGDPYPRRSCYDTFEMIEAADPGFSRHKALAQVVVLLAIELAQEPIVPIDLRTYSKALSQYVRDLDTDARAGGLGSDGKPWDVGPLSEAVEMLDKSAAEFHSWERTQYRHAPDGMGFESNAQLAGRVNHNDRLISFDRMLMDDGQDDRPSGSSSSARSKMWARSGRRPHPDVSSELTSTLTGPDDVRARRGDPASATVKRGLPGRTQFKHLIFGPPLLPFSLSQPSDGDPGQGRPPASFSSSSTFPFVRHHLLTGNWDQAMVEVRRAGQAIRAVAGQLLEARPAKGDGDGGGGDGSASDRRA